MKLNFYSLLFFLQITFAYRNIILIGMPNSGKSFLGKKLSENLNIQYYDCDELNPLFKTVKKVKKNGITLENMNTKF